MEKTNIKLKVKTALVLDQIVNAFLIKTSIDKEGHKLTTEREMPFRLKYRLNRNKVMLDKCVESFERQRMLLLAEYGSPTEDGKNVEIKDPEKYKIFRQKINELLDQDIENNVMLLEPEDIDQIRDTDLKIGNDATKVLIGYMTNDQELLEDLAKNIELKNEEKTNG